MRESEILSRFIKQEDKYRSRIKLDMVVYGLMTSVGGVTSGLSLSNPISRTEQAMGLATLMVSAFGAGKEIFCVRSFRAHGREKKWLQRRKNRLEKDENLRIMPKIQSNLTTP